MQHGPCKCTSYLKARQVYSDSVDDGALCARAVDANVGVADATVSAVSSALKWAALAKSTR